jgi:hypothetical protein
VTAAISLILVAMSYDEVWSSLTFLGRVWRKTRNFRSLWLAFWGGPGREAESVALQRKKAA